MLVYITQDTFSCILQRCQTNHVLNKQHLFLSLSLSEARWWWHWASDCGLASLGLLLMVISWLLQSKSRLALSQEFIFMHLFLSRQEHFLPDVTQLLLTNISQAKYISQSLLLLLNKQPQINSGTYSNAHLLLLHIFSGQLGGCPVIGCKLAGQAGKLLLHLSLLRDLSYPRAYVTVAKVRSSQRGKPWHGIGTLLLLLPSKSKINGAGKDILFREVTRKE